MSRPICLFTGEKDAFNVRLLVDNLSWMLPDERPVHLVTDARAAYDGYDAHVDRIIGGDSRRRWKAATALQDYLNAHDPAVVAQLTDPTVHGTIVGSLARLHGIPAVYRYSGDRFYEYSVARGRDRVVGFALGPLFGRLPLELATEHVVLGPSGRRRLISRGVDTDTITTLPPSIDRSRFADVAPHDDLVSSSRESLVVIGRISHLKGRGTLEKLIPRVLARCPDYEFVLVGDVQEPLQIPREFESAVSFPGRVEPEVVPQILAGGSLLLHPSLTEGIPRVVLESLAAGTPVLARDVGEVASVTENTFTTVEECLEMLCADVPLPLDDIEPFTRETLQPEYRAFFDGFQ